MATFARGTLSSKTTYVGPKRREPPPETVVQRPRTWVVDPVDALALRGLPAVGRFGLGGVVRGTQPESALMSKQHDR